MSRGSFLSRWSRLKQEAREKEAAPPVAPTEPDEEARHPPAAPPDDAPAPSADAASDAGQEAEAPPPDLPDVETLTKESDYTAFLRKEVPKALQRQALRKLWRSDPVFANLDGLNDYDDDYSKPAIVGKAVRTSFHALRGYAPAEPDAAAQTAGAGPAVEPDQDQTVADAPVADGDSPEKTENAEGQPEAVENGVEHVALPHEDKETKEPAKKPGAQG